MARRNLPYRYPARARSIPVFHVDIRLYAIGSTDIRQMYVGHEKVMEITTMWGSLRLAPMITPPPLPFLPSPPPSPSPQVAEENGMEVMDQLEANPVATSDPTAAAGMQTLTSQEEDKLSSRWGRGTRAGGRGTRGSPLLGGALVACISANQFTPPAHTHTHTRTRTQTCSFEAARLICDIILHKFGNTNYYIHVYTCIWTHMTSGF